MLKLTALLGVETLISRNDTLLCAEGGAVAVTQSRTVLNTCDLVPLLGCLEQLASTTMWVHVA